MEGNLSIKIKDTFKQGMIDLVVKYVEKPEYLKSLLVNCAVPIQVFVMVYNYCVHDGSLKNIESISQNEKQELWHTAKTWTQQAPLPKDKLIDLCKAIWLTKNVTSAAHVDNG